MMIMHIIFDPWLELRWNTCPCEIYIPLWGFSLFEWIWCFCSCSLETKCKMILISFIGFVNSIFVLSFLIVAFWEKWCFDWFRDWFFTKHVHNFLSIFIYYTYTIVIHNFLSILCLRTSKILSWGELISAIIFFLLIVIVFL